MLKHYPHTPVFIQHPPLIAHLVNAHPFKVLSQICTPPIIMNTPGHSVSSVFLYFPNTGVFVGDVVFAMGCGKIFTQDYEAAFKALQTLKALPQDTPLYWGHNYAAANYRFAQQHITSEGLRTYAHFIHKKGTPGLLQDELIFNPFLRAQTLDDFYKLRTQKG